MTTPDSPLLAALNKLIAASAEVQRYGAQTGPQWVKLTIALAHARAAVRGEAPTLAEIPQLPSLKIEPFMARQRRCATLACTRPALDHLVIDGEGFDHCVECSTAIEARIKAED